MTPAQIQTLIDACRTSPTDLVTWLELKAVLEGLKNQDLGLTLTTTGTSGPATLDIDTDILNIPNYSTDLTVYVPYTGANQNVNLGEYGIRSGWYQFDLTPTGTPTSASTMYWDDNQKTVALVMGGTTQEIGHDQFYHAKNSTGTTIPKGTAVRFAGTDGGSGHLLITPFLADGSNPSSYFMGVTAEAITNGSFGKVQSFGRLDGINTSAFAEGDILYASTTVAGGFQTTVPQAPNNIILVAAVISDSNNGKLLIRPTLGSKLTSDESVKLTSLANGQVLQYNSSLAVWQNVNASSLSVNNIYTADGTLTGNRTVTLNGNTLTFANGSSNSIYTALSNTSRYTLNATQFSEIIFRANSVDRGFVAGNFTGEFALGSLGGSFVTFYTSPSNVLTERMRIHSNGNIGINTTTDAGFRLDVSGTARISGQLTVSATINTSLITLIHSAGSTGTGISYTGTQVTIPLSLTTTSPAALANSSYRLIDGTVTYSHRGSTGMGAGFIFNVTSTNTDTTQLSTLWGGRITATSNATGTTAKALELTANSTSGTAIALETITGNVLLNTTSGNVGIGTTTPSYKLHTVGTGRITGNVELSVDSGAYTIIGATGDTTYRLSVDGDLRVYGSVRTANPSGGTSTKWRLGSYAAATVQLDTGGYLEVEVNGTAYKVGLVMLP